MSWAKFILHQLATVNVISHKWRVETKQKDPFIIWLVSGVIQLVSCFVLCFDDLLWQWQLCDKTISMMVKLLACVCHNNQSVYSVWALHVQHVRAVIFCLNKKVGQLRAVDPCRLHWDEGWPLRWILFRGKSSLMSLKSEFLFAVLFICESLFFNNHGWFS